MNKWQARLQSLRHWLQNLRNAQSNEEAVEQLNGRVEQLEKLNLALLQSFLQLDASLKTQKTAKFKKRQASAPATDDQLNKPTYH